LRDQGEGLGRAERLGAVYGRGMVAASMIISPQDIGTPGLEVRGASLVARDV